MKQWIFQHWALSFLFIPVCIFILLVIVVGWYLSVTGYTGQDSDHYANGKFFNRIKRDTSTSGFLKWRLHREVEEWPETLPMAPLKVTSPEDEDFLQFIGHSSFLVKIGKYYGLMDPVFSERCSPVSFAGPRRRSSPALKIEDLPKIDFVLISHNHYDHLDLPSVIAVNQKFSPVFITGLGNRSFLQKNLKDADIVELDWWDSWKTKDLSIEFVPAQHFSGRGLMDRNNTLWGGFILEKSDGNQLYFAGDTGYGDFFKDIHERFPEIHTALLPIGSYAPRWFMKVIHMSPEDAVKAARELGVKSAIATHFECFPLGDDAWDEPRERLQKALIPEEKDWFKAPASGEILPLWK